MKNESIVYLTCNAPSPPKNQGSPCGLPWFFDVEGFERERREPARVSDAEKPLTWLFEERWSGSKEYAEPSDAGEGRRLCDASGRHAASNLSFSAKEKSLNRKV